MAQSLFSVTSKPTFRELDGRFAKADAALLAAKREGMRALAGRFVTYAKDEAPKRSSRFSKAIRSRSFIEGDTVGFRIFSPQPLGTWIIEGTDPHPIVAKNAKFLRFRWPNGPDGDKIYYFKSVRHPGTKPNRYHERAHQRWLPEAQRELRRISTRYVEALQ